VTLPVGARHRYAVHLVAANFGVRPTDPLTFVFVAFLLALVALMAAWGPVRRARHVDPLTALRHDQVGTTSQTAINDAALCPDAGHSWSHLAKSVGVRHRGGFEKSSVQ